LSVIDYNTNIGQKGLLIQVLKQVFLIFFQKKYTQDINTLIIKLFLKKTILHKIFIVQITTMVGKRIPKYLYLLFVLITTIGQAQTPASTKPSTPYAPYGGVFTPKGTLRVLLVFVTYKDSSAANPNFNNKQYTLPDWDIYSNRGLPNFVNPQTGDCPSYLFNKEADFEILLDSVENNFSKEFYLMSQGQFKMIGEVFCDSTGLPTAVEIDPSKGGSWMQMNARAMVKMQALHPKGDWARFDQRKNQPHFRFDNSAAAGGDNILDYVVFVHAYNRNWGQQPKNSMRSWMGSGGGFAATGIPPQLTLNGYRVAQGFTMNYRSGVFIHEVAHELFNAPHIMGVNNVVGEYFSLMNAGWGVMAPISIFSGFNAWERWYTGFIELVADVQSPKDVAQNNTFILRDYFTTGDAMRIKIPYSGGQYLWLENHCKQHPLDEHPWKGSVLGVGDTVAGTATGVYAYVEAIAGSRNQIFSPLSACANGIKVLHAGGNYDYYYREDIPTLSNNWGNKLYSFTRGEENPIDGLNNFYRYPYDANKNGVIDLDKNYNISRTEGFLPIYREEVWPDSFVNLYGGFGAYDPQKCQGYVEPVAFQSGQVLDINSNPKPLNYPRYNYQKAEKQPYFLNGLALQFEQMPNRTDMQVTVAFGRTQLTQNQRWTGNIVLPNISQDTSPDLTIETRVGLLLEQGATPNTHLQTPKGGFTKPTILRIQKGATLQLKKRATLRIGADATLVLEEGAQLILDAKSKLIIQSTGRLVGSIESIIKHPRAKLVYKGKNRK
jgi:hypothetical protein